MSFVNQTGDPNLDPIGRMVADEISQGLNRISEIEVAPVTDFDLRPNLKVGDKQYRHIAKNTKSAMVIAGEYYLQGDRLSFRTNIYDAVIQQIAASPPSVSGEREDLSEALKLLSSSLLSAVLSIHDPMVKMWFVFSIHIPQFEALIECIKGLELYFVVKERHLSSFLTLPLISILTIICLLSWLLCPADGTKWLST